MTDSEEEAFARLERLRVEPANGEEDLATGRCIVISAEEELVAFFSGLR